MDLDDTKQPHRPANPPRAVTCPFLKQGHWGHGGTGNQDYCFGYGARKLRIPTLDERTRYCYCDQYSQCRTYRFSQEETRMKEAPGA